MMIVGRVIVILEKKTIKKQRWIKRIKTIIEG